MFILVSLSKKVYSNGINVSNEDELNNALNQNYTDIIITSSFSIKNNYCFFPGDNNSINISGITNDIILTIENEDIELQFKEYDYIEIKNLTFNGNIHIINCYYTNIVNIKFNGVFFGDNDDFYFITFKNIEYINSQHKISDYGFIFYNSLVSITGSKFIGSKSISKYILYSESNSEIGYYTSLSINNSYFSGEYMCGIIESLMTISSITNTDFANAVALNGSVFNDKKGILYVYGCKLINNYSYDSGGIFYSESFEMVTGFNLYISNSTAIHNGGIIYATSTPENRFNNVEFANIIVENINIPIYSNNPGIIASINDYSGLNIINIQVNNITCSEKNSCSLFDLKVYSNIYIDNININNIKFRNSDGLLIRYDDSFQTDVVIINLKLNNITNYGNDFSTIIASIINGNITMNGVEVNNFNGLNSDFIHCSNECYINLDEIYVDNVEICNTGNLININSGMVVMDNSEINNITINNPIINMSTGNIWINNSKFNNLYNISSSRYLYFDSDNDNNKKSNNLIIISNEYGDININNTIFSGFNGCYGFPLYGQVNLILENIYVENSYFENGFIFIKPSIINTTYQYDVKISNSDFKNNTSMNGSIIHIDYAEFVNYNILIDNSSFESNNAKQNGGIIYSLYYSPYKIVNFYNCIFKDNKAHIGNISYSYSITSEPFFNNKNEIIINNGIESFATNPSKIKINKIFSNNINIISGYHINDIISFYLFDDYDNLIDMGSDLDEMKIEELVFFSIEMNDKQNAIIQGQNKNYCWGTTCTFSNFEIIGNPGIYELIFKIMNFGKYKKFENSTYSLKLTINECDKNKYLYQIRKNENFKSCYMPICEPVCSNNGVCINDNICECSKRYTGKTCNEYYKLKRWKLYDILVRVISIGLIIISIFLLIALFIYKENNIIKKGGRRYLILILFGTILNYSYTILRTMERTNKKCLFIEIIKRIGFSLIYGSLSTKTLSLYYVINSKLSRKILTIKNMIVIIYGMILYHMIIITINELLIGHISIIKYTQNLEEYKDCKYSNLSSLSLIFNYVIIIICCSLMYSLRRLNHEYKESITVPVYAYIVVETLIVIIDRQNYSVIIKDIFNTFGTILYSLMVIIMIFASKFNQIYREKQQLKKKMTAYLRKKNNKMQMRFDSSVI